VSAIQRVTTRNARFQQWEALLTNRNKRQRAGRFWCRVYGRSLAVEHGWEIRALLYDMGANLSTWATQVLDRPGTTKVAVSSELMRDLGGKTEVAPQLLAVVGTPEDDLLRIKLGADPLVLVFDRPTSPGNIGTLVRSADAFGAAGVIVTGHGADIYDPKAVRASTGSIFTVPTVRVASHHQVLTWVAATRSAGVAMRLVGTDERGEVEAADVDLTVPSVLLIGNETTGLSVAWRQSADDMVRIPMTGSASSLNAATAASIMLYEAARQRSARRRG
jgi:TrmH family RNA methyltransferase